MNTIFDIQRFVDTVVSANYIGTNGNDSINSSVNSSSSSGIVISALGGNDRITHSSGKAVTIKGGAGKDTIRAYAENAYIDGGEGNDIIDLQISSYVSGAKNNTGGATIIGGKGNDVIALDATLDAGSATGRVIVYNEGDGNDFIQGLRASDTIIIATENGSLPVLSEKKDGDDYIVNIGSGKITLKGVEESVMSAVTFAKGTFSINEETEIISVSDTGTAVVPTLVSGTSAGENYTEGKANTASNVVYDLVGGADKFGNNGGNYVLVYGGAGNDTLTNTKGNNVTLDGGAGNDLLEANSGTGVLLIGGAGNDTFSIASEASTVTINGGAGNDYIDAQNNTLPNFYIYGEGEGKDTIAGYKTGDTIQLTAGYVDISKAVFSGSDFVIPVGSGSITLKDLAKTDITEVTITNADGSTTTVIQIPQELFGTKGADTLTNEKSGKLDGESLTPFKIDGLAGNDQITNTGDYVLIYGGAGNDSITLGGGTAESINHGTINGGKGNDAVTIDGNNHAYLFEYASGDGNDSIYGLGESDTLVFGTSTIGTAISADGKNFLLTSGKTTVAVADYKGGDTFKIKLGNAEDSVFALPKIWQGTKNADTVDNTIAGYSLYALGGSDSITNSGASVQIYSDVGDDYISNTGASVTIDGGAGKDVIDNSGSGASIVGGAGNDSIKNTGDSLTIAAEGDNPASTVTVQIYGGDGVDTIDNTGSGVEIYGEDGNDIINNSGSSVKIDGGDGTDNISVSGSATGVQITGGKGNDTIIIESGSTAAHTFTYSIGDGNDNIYGFNANDVFYLYDTDGTTLDSGSYKTEISDKDLIITVGTGKNAGKITLHNVVGNVTKTTINGAEVPITKILYGDEKDNTLTADSNSYLVKALAGNDTVSIVAEVTGTSVEGGTGNDYIYGNDKGNVYIYNDGDGNDTISGFTASDTISLGEDAKLGDTVVSGTDLILNIGKGSIVLTNVIGSSVSSVKVGEDEIDISTLKPVIIGTTKADKFYGDAANTGDGVLVSVGAGNDTVENFGASVTVLAGAGNDFLYNEGPSSELYGEAGNDTIENYADTVTIDAGVGNDHIFNAGSKVTIDGGDGNDTIESFGDNVTVDGGAGTDYIYSDGTGNSVGGGADNDTIEIAGSQTTVIYASGDGADTVYGFTENDILQIDSAQLSSTSADGTDVILKIGSGSVRLMDMAGKKINYKDSSGTATETVVSGAITGTARADNINNTYVGFTINALAGNDTVTNSGSDTTIDGGTGADVITNTNTGANVNINGGTGNDVITSSGNSVTIDGGSGHDKITIGSSSSEVTVTAGKGNDTITATGASNVLFNYASGDGRDVITDFSEGDTLKITSGKISADDITGDTNAVLKIGNGSITFNGVAKDNLEVNNNTVTYTAASGGNGNAAVLWFMEDDTNFIGGATVDEITAQEYSVTNVEKTDSTDELTQLEKFTASYGGDK